MSDERQLPGKRSGSGVATPSDNSMSPGPWLRSKRAEIEHRDALRAERVATERMVNNGLFQEAQARSHKAAHVLDTIDDEFARMDAERDAQTKVMQTEAQRAVAEAESLIGEYERVRAENEAGKVEAEARRLEAETKVKKLRDRLERQSDGSQIERLKEMRLELREELIGVEEEISELDDPKYDEDERVPARLRTLRAKKADIKEYLAKITNRLDEELGL